MLKLNKRSKDAVRREREELERKIARTDREIDALVYELYGLTEEEGRVVKGLNREWANYAKDLASLTG